MHNDEHNSDRIDLHVHFDTFRIDLVKLAPDRILCVAIHHVLEALAMIIDTTALAAEIASENTVEGGATKLILSIPTIVGDAVKQALTNAGIDAAAAQTQVDAAVKQMQAQIAPLAAALTAGITPPGGGATAPPGPVAPSITSQPQNVSAAAGAAASFSVVAAGDAPLAYQWERNGSAITGETSASLSLPSVSSSDDQASFTVAVSNAAGSVTSSAAVLTVTPVSAASA